MNTQTSATDLLAAILPGLSMAQKIEQAKIDAVRKKAEYDAAQRVVDEYAAKKNRDQIRAQKRRDEIVGRVFSAVCVARAF